MQSAFTKSWFKSPAIWHEGIPVKVRHSGPKCLVIQEFPWSRWKLVVR